MQHLLCTCCSIWCGEHGHSHGWGPGGWARGERGEEYDVSARHAQVEAGPVHGLHSVWRLHWLRCQLCQQRSARQSTRGVRRHTCTALVHTDACQIWNYLLNCIMYLCVYCYVNVLSVCVFLHPSVSVAVGPGSLAARPVAVAKLVPGSWMVRRPDREASLMLWRRWFHWTCC